MGRLVISPVVERISYDEFGLLEDWTQRWK